MIEFPKIETLYDRDEKTRKVIIDKVRLPEFLAIKEWSVTEKVDGTNIRIGYSDGKIDIGGRTDNAQIPTFLLSYLRDTFTVDKFAQAFPDGGNVVLFGEGYGEKIQKGGGNYRKGVALRLFDVMVGEWWLERDGVIDVASKFNILPVPELGTITYLPQFATDLKTVLRGGQSIAAQEDGGAGLEAEGIVARSVPMLFNRRGHRVMWKLKFRDF